MFYLKEAYFPRNFPRTLLDVFEFYQVWTWFVFYQIFVWFFLGGGSDLNVWWEIQDRSHRRDWGHFSFCSFLLQNPQRQQQQQNNNNNNKNIMDMTKIYKEMLEETKNGKVWLQPLVFPNPDKQFHYYMGSDEKEKLWVLRFVFFFLFCFVFFFFFLFFFVFVFLFFVVVMVVVVFILIFFFFFVSF